MLLEPSNVRIVWHGQIGLIGARFSSRILPFMAFDMAVRKGDRAAAVVIVGGNIPHQSLRTGINHIYHKKRIVNGIGAFIYENESRGRTGVVDGGKFVGIVEQRQGSAAILPPFILWFMETERTSGYRMPLMSTEYGSAGHT